jgi:chorismate mutase
MYRSDLHPTPPELRAIRDEIDEVDLALVDLIARRVALARRTVPLKAARGLAFRNPHREAGLVRRAAELAKQRGIDPEPVRAIFWQLVDLSHASIRAADVREDGTHRE